MTTREELYQRFGPQFLEAIGLMVRDEFNIIRNWLNSFKTEVAASSSLADLQTRIAGLPNMPDMTNQQIMNILEYKLDNTVIYDWAKD